MPADRVTLWVEWPNESAPLAVQQLERELQAIVEPSGLELGWRRLPAKAGAVVDGASIVVRFRGQCLPESTDRARRPAAGWAHASDGAILPFIEIDCDQVWSAIEPAIESEPGLQREIHLGRALARVVAHELYHVLANTAAHGTHGLTKAKLDSRDLTTGSYSLTEAELRPRVQISDSSPSESPATGVTRSRGSREQGWTASSSSATHSSDRSFPAAEATGR